MKQLRVGHIGWLSFDEGEDCRTVAWCDIDGERLRRAGNKRPAIALYTDYREMLREAKLDAVAISTPNWVHAEQIVAFLEAGVDVFVEKPMGITRAECDRILRCVRRTGRNFTVDFEMRVAPFAERVHELLASGETGAVRRVEMIHHRGCWLEEGNGRWRVRPEQSGGHFLMEPIHEIDIFRSFLGDITAVQTISGPNVLDHYRFADNLCCHLWFASGVQGLLLATHTLSARIPPTENANDPAVMARYGHDMQMILTCEKASVLIDFIGARITVNPIVPYPTGTGGKQVVHGRVEEFGNAHAFGHDINKMRRTFLRRCATGEPMVQDPIDIWKTHLVCLEAEASMMGAQERRVLDYTLPD